RSYAGDRGSNRVGPRSRVSREDSGGRDTGGIGDCGVGAAGKRAAGTASGGSEGNSHATHGIAAGISYGDLQLHGKSGVDGGALRCTRSGSDIRWRVAQVREREVS